MLRRITYRQGQYLAFITWFTETNGCPPSEGDMARFFNVRRPSAHRMVLILEQRGYIYRVPKRARTIRVLVPDSMLPDLER